MKQVEDLASIGLRTSNITNQMTQNYAIVQIIRQSRHQDAVCIIKRVDPIDEILLAQVVVIPSAKTSLWRIKNVALSALDGLLKL